MRTSALSCWTGALLTASLVPAAPQPGPDRDALEFYVEIVALYRHGDVKGALDSLGERPPAQLREAVDDLARYVQARREPPLSLPAAVLLHTDRALRDREQGARDAESFQLGLARKLVDLLEDVPGSDDFRRRWHLAVGNAWKQGEDWGLARELLDAGLQSFPNDAGLLVARAAIEETVAAFTETREEPVRPIRSNLARAVQGRLRQTADARQHRLAALDLLRRALAAAPDDERARLRLGRVLLELRQSNEGLATLEPLREAGHDPRFAYLALLIYGGGLERSGRLTAAIESYQAAVKLEPRAQTARLALAHALEQAGAPEAGAALGDALAVTTQHPDFEDPWATYHFERSNLLDPLRNEVRR